MSAETPAMRAGEGEGEAAAGPDTRGGHPGAPGGPPPPGPRYSLQSLLALLVLATAAPLIAMLFYAALHAADAETERANQTVSTLAEVTAADAAGKLAELQRLALFLAERPQVRALDPAACDPVTGDLLRVHSELINLATVDANGQVICSLLGARGSLPNVGASAWMRELKRSGSAVLGQPQRGIYSGRWIVILAYPLQDAGGTLKGAVEVVIDMASFQPLASLGLPDGGLVAINDSYGNVIARAPEPENFVGRNLANSQVTRMVLSQRQGSGIAVSTSGQERFYAFKPVGDSGWFAVAGMPTASIYAQAQRNAWRAAGLGAVVLLAAALLALLVQRRISLPMHALTATARRVAAGELGERARQEGPREVAEVAAGFNHMLDQIPQMRDALRASESRYRSLVEVAPEALVVERHARVLLVNAAAVRLYGATSAAQMIGMEIYDLVHPDYHEVARMRARTASLNAAPNAPLEQRHVGFDGKAIDVETTGVRLDFEGEPAVLVMVRDLRARKAAERRVTRLSHLYAALSKTNEAIFRESGQFELCSSVCEIAVTEGRLVSAAIRLYDKGSGMLMPYCGFGPLSGWIGERPLPLDESRSRAARAARERAYYICNDIFTDPEVAASREDAARVGVRSSGGFPFSIDGELVGVFSVYAAEENFFDAELAALLDEMAKNLSFAFSKIRAATALAGSEERYRALFDASPDAVRVFHNKRVVMINPAGVRLLGFDSAAQIIGRPASDFYEPADAQAARERYRIVIGERKPAPPDEQVLIRADGSRVEVEAITLPFDYEGQPAALSIMRDLTARKAAAQRVQRLTALYAALSRTNEAIFRESDPLELCRAVCEIAVNHAGLTLASIRRLDAATGMLGHYASFGPDLALVGRSPVALNDPKRPTARFAREGSFHVSNDIASDPGLAGARRELLLDAGLHSAGWFGLQLDGAPLGLFAVYTGVPGYFDAEFTGLIGEMARNLSFAFGRQKAAAALASSEERYRMLFEASPDAIRVVCEDRVVMINPAGVRLFGLDSSEGMVGKLVFDTIDPQFRGIAMQRIREVIDERRPVPLSEQALIRADGTRIDVEVVSLPFEYEGKPAALSIVHDLTARKAVERATLRMNAELEDRVRRRTAELQQANADLESFSYTVAHDLRAPLRRMSGFAGLLKETVGGKLDSESRQFLERISEGGRTMERLIEGLLELAQLGRAELRPGDVDLSALAGQLIAEMREREPLRKIDFTAAPGLTARGDPRLIRSVLENLLGNALKFTSAHAQSRIEFGALPPGSEAGREGGREWGRGRMAGTSRMRAYYVRDDGAGFDPRHADKLFGTFQRLHTQGQFPGTGVGLASVKRIINDHGGVVWAEGGVERGATFYFTLPEAEALKSGEPRGELR